MNMMIHGRAASMTALLRHSDASDQVARALTGITSLTLRSTMGDLAATPADALLRDQPDLLLVDADLTGDADLAALENLVARCPPNVPILVTAQRPSIEGMRLLLRLGIADLLPQPMDPNLLLEAVSNAIRTARSRSGQAEPGERGTVIAFLKAGGGVGATTLAVHSACALGGGRPGDEAQTCLLDFDLQFGAAALHLDIEHSASLMELPDISQRFDRTLLRSAMAHHRSGIDLLPAPTMLHPLDVVTPETVTTLIHAAALDYAQVLVDLPQSWTAWTRAVLAEANAIVLVLRPDVPSIRQARRQLETLAAEGLGHIPLIPVANFCATGPFAKTIPVAEAARALGLAIDHSIARMDTAFGIAANEGLPLAEIKGGRRPAKGIGRLIRAVLAAARF